MPSNTAARRPMRAITLGFASLGMLALAGAWPLAASAQDAAAPGAAMFACSTIQRPRLTELGQAAAAARKSSNLVVSLRVRQLEAQLTGVNAALVGVQNAADCQKVAAQIDTLRERLGRLAPESLTASAAGAPAATVPVAGAPTAGVGAAAPAAALAAPAANAESDAIAVGCATAMDPNACRDLSHSPTELRPPGLAAQPAAAPQPAYVQPQPQPSQPAQEGRGYLECQVSNRRDLSALEKEIHAVQASGRMRPGEVVPYNQAVAQWRMTVNATLLPAHCEQVSLNIAAARTQVAQMAARPPLPVAAAAPAPPPHPLTSAANPAVMRAAAPAPTAAPVPAAAAAPAPVPAVNTQHAAQATAGRAPAPVAAPTPAPTVQPAAPVRAAPPVVAARAPTPPPPPPPPKPQPAKVDGCNKDKPKKGCPQA